MKDFFNVNAKLTETLQTKFNKLTVFDSRHTGYVITADCTSQATRQDCTTVMLVISISSNDYLHFENDVC